MEKTEEKRKFPTVLDEFLAKPRTNLELKQMSVQISNGIKEYSDKLRAEGVKDYHNQARAKANKTYGKFWRETLSMKMTHEKGDIQMSYH